MLFILKCYPLLCLSMSKISGAEFHKKWMPSNPRKNTILMDFLVYGNRKCLWIRCMFGWRTLITIARVNCILGLMQVLMADCFSYVKQSVWKSLKKVSFYINSGQNAQVPFWPKLAQKFKCLKTSDTNTIRGGNYLAWKFKWDTFINFKTLCICISLC